MFQQASFSFNSSKETDDTSMEILEEDLPPLNLASLDMQHFYFSIDSLNQITHEKAANFQTFSSIVKISPFQHYTIKSKNKFLKKQSTIGGAHFSECSTIASLKRVEFIEEGISSGSKKSVSYISSQDSQTPKRKGILKLELSRYSQDFSNDDKRPGRQHSIDVLRYHRADKESQDDKALAQLETIWETGSSFVSKKDPRTQQKRIIDLTQIYIVSRNGSPKSKFYRTSHLQGPQNPFTFA